MRTYFDLGLMATYAIASVSGLVLMRSGLSEIRTAFTAGNWLGSSAASAGLGIVLYVASFAIWMVILSRNELSLAYPIAIGLTLMGATTAGFLLLHEPFTLLRSAGCVLIFLGILCLVKS